MCHVPVKVGKTGKTSPKHGKEMAGMKPQPGMDEHTVSAMADSHMDMGGLQKTSICLCGLQRMSCGLRGGCEEKRWTERTN